MPRGVYTRTAEHRAKLSTANRGNPKVIEAGRKSGLVRRSRPSLRKGCSPSLVTRAKQSIAQRRRFQDPSERAKVGVARKGRSLSCYEKFMKAIGQAVFLRAKAMNGTERAFYDGLVALYGEGEVLREVPFGPYVVDFYVPNLHLAYELDGRGHEWKGARDQQRDAWLVQFAGLPVSRVNRSEVESLRFQ